MYVENLLEQLEAISELLKNSSLQQPTSQLGEIEKLVEEFDELVEKIKSQHDQKLFPDDFLKPILSELQEKLIQFSQLCDINLAKLNFLKDIKPVD
jgi:hypothetical protein|tara:strand:+ start:495 stop:782 length:288 start_codon:yes stop_codon:yes gene_type:complete